MIFHLKRKINFPFVSTKFYMDLGLFRNVEYGTPEIITIETSAVTYSAEWTKSRALGDFENILATKHWRFSSVLCISGYSMTSFRNLVIFSF